MSSDSSKRARALRPRAIMLAVAAACTLPSVPCAAQTTAPVLPTGENVRRGLATFDRATAGTLNVNITQNGAGTSHSVIDWKTFSIGAGGTARFQQPAGSTSINRVVTNTPSSLLGTLSSNGKLVLVNQAGITVGAGAVVDTAGFTASTLAMCDADAFAGTMNFLCGGSTGPLKVEGRISGGAGDVILVSPEIEVASSGVLAAQGRALLLAGDTVQVSERGLEGIVLTVRGPERAVNAGLLQAGAVGIFAGSLTHSGLVIANGIGTIDGKVVLKALAGDATVSGSTELLQSSVPNGGIEVSADNSILGEGRYAAHGNAVSLTAKRGSVRFAAIGSNGSFSGVTGGAVTVTAQGDVSGQSISATGAGNCCGVGAKGGAIVVQSTAGNIQLASADAGGGAASEGIGGEGGSIRLTALGTGPDAGVVDISDPGGQFTAALAARGGIGFGFASEGGTPNAGGKGGSIVLQAGRSVRIGTALNPSLASAASLAAEIDASGGFAQRGVGGDGGTINLSAGTGDVTMVGGVQAFALGGFGAQGGQGGSILMNAGGNLTLGQILASGGFGTEPVTGSVGGKGGRIGLDAGGSITASLLEASGGPILPLETLPTEQPTLAVAVAGPGGIGGAGGDIQVNARAGNVTIGGISADGGSGADGPQGAVRVGGNGGNVAISAGGNVTLATEADGLVLFGIVADGGTGTEQGGNGGTIAVKSGATFTVQVPDPNNVDLLGGVRAVGGAGGRGGSGGDVALAARDFSLPFVEAFGGAAASGPGGAGGKIALTQSAGDFIADARILLDARGGAGGNAASTGSGGAGGAGGAILLAADGGAVRLRGPQLAAAGGQGGSNAGGGRAANGAAGAFAATGTSVEVEGDFTFDAAWNNAGLVNLTGASVASLAGPFNNLAGAMLAGTGTLRLAGGAGTLDNRGTIAPGADGSVGTLSVEGNLVMRAGSTLAADLRSATGSDLLKVSGTATVDSASRVLVKFAPSASLAAGDSVTVLQAASLPAVTLPPVAEAGGTPRPAGVVGLAAGKGAAGLLVTAVAPPAPAPQPRPQPEPQAPEAGQLARPEVREVLNATTAFVQDFDRLVERGRPLKKRDRDEVRDDIVVTDSACKR